MNALVLASVLLFARPAAAGVVASVDAAAVPTSPVGPVAPIQAPVGGILSATLGNLGLGGSIPVLPAPVPGLSGAVSGFIGDGHTFAPVGHQESAAAATQPGTAPSGGPTAQTPVAGRRDAPIVPGAPTFGANAQFTGRDRRKTGASVAADGASASVDALTDAVEGQEAADAAASGARVSAERSAAMGRRFFDRSRNEGRGEIVGGGPVAASDGGSPAFMGGLVPAASSKLLALSPSGGALSGAPLAASKADPSDALGWGHGAAFDRTGAPADLKDAPISPSALAGVPPAALAGASAGGAPSAAAAATPGAASVADGVVPFGSGAFGSAFSAPKPLAVDLSGSGLVVTVSNALESFAGGAKALVPARPASSVSPTSLLERGGLLEAVETAESFAGAGAKKGAATASFRASREPAVPRKPAPSSPSSNWLWAFAPFALLSLYRRL